MTLIEVDYNERDEEGRVIAGVSYDQLLTLHTGQAVTLYDPIDRLRADATVAWIEADVHAVGFDVDWTSFEDQDLPEKGRMAGASAAGQLTHTSVDELARPDLFESDEELAEFLADLYASRHREQHG